MDKGVDLAVVHDGVGKVDTVHQFHVLDELHADVLVVRLLVRRLDLFQRGLQLIPLGGNGHNSPVHIEGGSLLDLTAGGLQDGVGHMGLVHHRAASHRKRIGRGNGPFPAGGTGGDTGLQVGAGGIKYGLALHIAHHAAVHLHRQHVLVIHHGAHGVHKDSQRHQRHHIGHRTAHQRKIHPGTAPQVGKALLGGTGLAELLRLLLYMGADVAHAVGTPAEGGGKFVRHALSSTGYVPADDAAHTAQHAAKIGSGFTGPPDRAQAGIFTPVTQLIQSPAHRTSGGGGGSALQHSQKLSAQRGGSVRFGARFGPAAPGRRHGRFHIRFLTPFC